MLIFPHTLYLLLPLTPGVVLAQSSSLPPVVTTTNLTKERPYEERVSLARAAIDIDVNAAVVTDGNGTFMVRDLAVVTPVLHSLMAEFDILTHNTTYRDLLKVQLTQASALILNSSNIYDHMGYGYATIKAYIAYKDDHYLALAQQFWESGRAQCISDEDIESKSISTKTLPLRTECNGKSLLGGVFATKNLTNGQLEHRSTSGLFTLSALLAEVTLNTTYTKVANQTLQFLKNFSYFPRSNGPQNEKTITAFDIDLPCHGNVFPSWYPDTGPIIEGLSILASVTNDTSVKDLLQDAINSSTIYRDTKQLDGVVELSGVPYGFPSGDPYLVRGLATAYRRNHVDLKVSGYVKEFITVQYNALLDNLTLEQSGIRTYIDPTSGPLQRSGLVPQNQTYAAMVFVQVINSTSTSGGNTSSPSPSPSPSGTSNQAIKTGEIVGAVVGGLGVVLFLGLAVLFCRRQRRRRPKVPSIYLTSPFHLPDSEMTTTTTTTSPIHVKPRLISPTSRKNSQLNSPHSPQETFREEVDVVQEQEIGSIPNPHERFNAMSTPEMARLFNARLQAESQNDMPPPPAYPQSQIGDGP